MHRLFYPSLLILCSLQLFSQSIELVPLESNPALRASEYERTISSRSNDYTQEVILFKGESISLCADTARLEQPFQSINNLNCANLDWGNLGFSGHCIEFFADDVSQNRIQEICIEVRDQTGSSFTWTIFIDIRTPLSIPFAEDFYEDSHRPDPAKWMDREVYVNNTWAKDPISIGVATFDGIDENGKPYGGGQIYADTLTSTFIDLSGLSITDPVYLTFWIQPGGLGGNFGANPEDSLFLQFKRPDGSWDKVFSMPGTNSFDSLEFELQTIRVNPNYFQEGFQFRFYNHSNLEGITDLWHLDYLKLSLDANPDIYERDISFTRPPLSILNPYTSMPWHHFTGHEEKYTRDSVKIELFGHFPNTSLADTSEFSLRERNTGIEVLPNETLLEVPPFVSVNQPNVDYGPHEYVNPIKNIDIIRNSLSSDFSSDEADYTFISSYSFSQAQEVLQEWMENNFVQRETRFSNYFAYDDGSAEKGIHLKTGEQGNPMLAIEFTAETGDTLQGIHMLLPHIQEEDENHQINLMVWTGSLDNEPIYRDEFVSPIYPDQYFDTLGGFTTYTFKASATGEDTILYIPQGKFYIGWQGMTVFNEVGMYVGFDKNSPDGAKFTYFNPGDGNWIPLLEANPSLVGSIMMRPVFGDQRLVTTDIDDPQLNPTIRLYPNPGNGLFHIELPESLDPAPSYIVSDQIGQIVADGSCRNSSLDLRQLRNGMYFVRFYWPENGLEKTVPIIISNEQ